jgi:hypothetical protein
VSRQHQVTRSFAENLNAQRPTWKGLEDLVKPTQRPGGFDRARKIDGVDAVRPDDHPLAAVDFTQLTTSADREHRWPSNAAES